MRKLALFILVLLSIQSKAQNWEIGFFGGVSTYRGDLAPRIVPAETHPTFGIGIKRNVNRFVTLALDVKHGKISGDDRNFDHLQSRNLRFHSPLTEVSATTEFNFFPFLKGLKPKQFTPFLFTGFSMFRFNPKTEYEGKTYDLRDLSTEGQGVQEDAPDKYSLYQPAIPIGGGFFFAAGARCGASVGLLSVVSCSFSSVFGSMVSWECCRDSAGPFSSWLWSASRFTGDSCSFCFVVPLLFPTGLRVSLGVVASSPDALLLCESDA